MQNFSILLEYNTIFDLALMLVQIQTIYYILLSLLIIFAIFILKNIEFLFNLNTGKALLNDKLTSPLGIIYDSKNLNPIAYAKIKLIEFKKSNNKVNKQTIESTFSNKSGLYSFKNQLLEKNFFIEVNAFGFKPYYKEIIADDYSSLDIKLKRINKKFSLHTTLSLFSKIFEVILFLNLSFGIFLFSFEILSTESILEIIALVVYIAVLLNFVSTKSNHLIFKRFDCIEKLLMYKINGVVVRQFRDNKLIDIKISNLKGFIKFKNLKPDDEIFASKEGYLFFKDKEGVINSPSRVGLVKRIKLSKINSHPVKKVVSSKKLINPFSAK